MLAVAPDARWLRWSWLVVVACSAVQAAEPQMAAVFGPEPRQWEVRLTGEDAAKAFGMFFRALSGEEDCGAGGSLGSWPVFFTVYAPGRPPWRMLATGLELAFAARKAGRQVRADWGESVEAAKVRVRLDIVRSVRPVEGLDLEAFAAGGGLPGVAVRAPDGGWGVFLPCDYAAGLAPDVAGALAVASQQACGDPKGWADQQCGLWAFDTVGYVNSADGSSYALGSPDGLVETPEPALSDLLRGLRLAADYLVRNQAQDGTYMVVWDAATGLRGGCASVKGQAAAAAALGMACELRPDPRQAASCYNALSWLMAYTDPDPADPERALTRRRESCGAAGELEASAQVLEALCRYRRISGFNAPTGWIKALARFLLSMQRQDGLFELHYDPETGVRSTRPEERQALEPHARASLALCLAYRELDDVRFLEAAGRALEGLEGVAALKEDGPSARQAAWLAAALYEWARAGHADRAAGWLRALASQRLQAGQPATAEELAHHLLLCAAAAAMGGPHAQRFRASALSAARALLHLQFTPENSYYLTDPATVEGAFRERVGLNISRLDTVEAALRGLVILIRVELENGRESREGAH